MPNSILLIIKKLFVDGIIDDTLLEELTKIDEILDIKQLHV